MQLKIPENLMRMILPGLFLTYLAATILAFLLHAQYFNDVLAKTFAEPSLPTQVAVNIPLLNRVATLIKLDQNNIAALTTSIVRKAITTESATITPSVEATGTVPAIDTESVVATSTQNGTSAATTTATSSRTPAARRP